MKGTASTTKLRTALSPRLALLSRYFAEIPVLGPLSGLLLLVAFFSIRSSVFFTSDNFSQIFQQVMEVGTLAIGQTIIIIAAGIDLSNGAIMVLGSVVMA